MIRSKSSQMKIMHYISFIMIFFIYSSSFATSRAGTVKIIDYNGTPCFSVPNNSETKNGLPLHGLFVNELPNKNDDGLPRSIWSFRATDYNSLPNTFPKHCIPFGELPDGTTERALEPLQLLKVYSVYLQAKHEGSSMDGYSGEFCIKPAGSGRTVVQVIREDYSLGDARFEGCVK